MKKIKFIVEQGVETKAANKGDWYVIRAKDRLYRWQCPHPATGADPNLPTGAVQHWSTLMAPLGWESFPIWPGTEPEEIEVRARLEVSNNGALELRLNDEHVAWLASERGRSFFGTTDAIEVRLKEIREGKP